MDPLSTIGLAAAVLQFIQFVGKTCYMIYSFHQDKYGDGPACAGAAAASSRLPPTMSMSNGCLRMHVSSARQMSRAKRRLNPGELRRRRSRPL